MLQASLHWHSGNPVVIDVLPDREMGEWLLEKKREGSRMEMKNLLASLLPNKFVDLFTQLYFSHNDMPLIQIPDQVLKSFANQLKHWKVIPEATVGYQKAEVTRGGVCTDELSSKTMESKKVPGIYFVVKWWTLPVGWVDIIFNGLGLRAERPGNTPDSNAT